MRLLKLAALVLLCAMSTSARDSSNLPDRPQPRTADKEFVIDASALATAWTLDTISTNQRFEWCQKHYRNALGHQPDCFENGGFFDGTRDTAKIMAAWAGVDAAAVIGSYEWKKHVHNKYLHFLWRVPLLVGTERHTQAAIENWGYPRK
jgi:hypothetical protein